MIWQSFYYSTFHVLHVRHMLEIQNWVFQILLIGETATAPARRRPRSFVTRQITPMAPVTSSPRCRALVTTSRCSRSAPGAHSTSRCQWIRPASSNSSRFCQKTPPAPCTQSPSQSSSAPPSLRPRPWFLVTNQVTSPGPAQTMIGGTLLAPAWSSRTSQW